MDPTDPLGACAKVLGQSPRRLPRSKYGSQSGFGKPNSMMNHESDIVVACVDSNPRYLPSVDWWFRYWDLVGPHFRRPIEPVLLTINVKPSLLSLQANRRVVPIEIPNWIDTAFAAQTARLYWPGTQIHFAGRILTTDIDCLPLSTKVFDSTISCGNETFIVYRNVLSDVRQVPICYNSATSNSWRQVMGDRSLEDAVANLWSMTAEYHGIRGGVGWSIDQETLFRSLHDWMTSGGQVLWLQDSETGHRRLDRSHSKKLRNLARPLLGVDFFTDFHTPMPASDHTKELASVYSWLSRRWRNQKFVHRHA